MTGHDEYLIAYCGLYCGDCLVFKGEIADLAKTLVGKFEETEFERVAKGLPIIIDDFKALANYKQCRDALCSLDGLRCKKVCRQGGGSKSCKIRDCCENKSLAGCWQCREFEDCRVLGWLEPVHRDGHLKNLRRIRDHGTREFIRGEKCW
ncbi:MAG: DUF3795 domain-containing protein [Thermodesulfobacteriota bacterium]|nr:DUF3795 domain-containing protein [Thermodesulfobacteriota bacterium]